MKLKRTAAILITLLLTAGAAGCADTREIRTQPGGEYRIVASFYPMYLLTLGVAGDIPGVSVDVMTPRASGCLHDYQLTPSDLRRLLGADVLVINGAGMESFLERLAGEMPGLPLVNASEGIALLTEDGEANAHVWVSVTGAISEVQNILDGLCRLDPAHSGAYRANAAGFTAKLEALRQQMAEGLAGLKHREIVTFHEAFPYFAQEFGLTVAAAVESDPGASPSAMQLSRIITLVKEKGIPALFTEPQYPPDAALIIANETGAKLYPLDPVVTGPDGAKAQDYITAMENNLKVLEEALN
jgi:zinc transport system substrate-binding protein